MPDDISPSWDLNAIFAGGSQSPEFAEFRTRVKADLTAAEDAAKRLDKQRDAEATEQWVAFILGVQDIGQRISTASSFAGCLVSQNVHDDVAHRINSETDVMWSRWLGLRTALESFALEQDDHRWEALLRDTHLVEIGFFLRELRDQAREKMPPPLERLTQELAVDGYHAWNRIYDKMAGDITVQFTVDGESRPLSLGQLANYMSSPKREIRRTAFEKLEQAWESRANLAAMMLNAQAGFRLALYRNRNWEGFLHEPLRMARLQRETLDAMWSAVQDGVPRISKYIEAKRQLLGIDRFLWHDQIAPVGSLNRSYSFEEAGRFIVEQLADFSPEMAEFTQMALRRRWVEAENRPGKAGGAFCTDFPTHQATRVFMTWGGQYAHLLTLAHELGHAYHGWVLRETPFLSQQYPMTLAETASTFNELRVTDAALRRATDRQERLMLLDQKLQNAYLMFCNLRARFLFDCAFYTERSHGVVPKARLDELMMDAQRQAFGSTLSDPDGLYPSFWASKLHFFITSHPFYNFPYVFGYLFASGVYHKALNEGVGFADKYRDLLADTGRLSSEDVAKKHLHVDLTRRDFWDSTVRHILDDVDLFVEMAASEGG